MPSREAIGRSRGGLTSKIHLAADRRCRPIARVTSWPPGSLRRRLRRRRESTTGGSVPRTRRSG